MLKNSISLFNNKHDTNDFNKVHHGSKGISRSLHFLNLTDLPDQFDNGYAKLVIKEGVISVQVIDTRVKISEKEHLSFLEKGFIYLH